MELSNRFKDYISNPKENNYQSIHTTMCDTMGNIFEVQIRDLEMDKIAVDGTASHEQYKKNQESVFNDDNRNSRENAATLIKKCKIFIK